MNKDYEDSESEYGDTDEESNTEEQSEEIKTKEQSEESNTDEETDDDVDDDIFNSDDEDQIFNEAYNFNNKKRNKIDSFEDYNDVESDWEKVEEGLGEINESEWERLFGIIPEMENEPENENVIWQPWVVEPEKEK